MVQLEEGYTYEGGAILTKNSIIRVLGLLLLLSCGIGNWWEGGRSTYIFFFGSFLSLFLSVGENYLCM